MRDHLYFEISKSSSLCVIRTGKQGKEGEGLLFQNSWDCNVARSTNGKYLKILDMKIISLSLAFRLYFLTYFHHLYLPESNFTGFILLTIMEVTIDTIEHWDHWEKHSKHWHHCRCPGVFIVSLEHVLHLFLVFLLLT